MAIKSLVVHQMGCPSKCCLALARCLLMAACFVLMLAQTCSVWHYIVDEDYQRDVHIPSFEATFWDFLKVTLLFCLAAEGFQAAYSRKGPLLSGVSRGEERRYIRRSPSNKS